MMSATFGTAPLSASSGGFLPVNASEMPIHGAWMSISSHSAMIGRQSGSTHLNCSLRMANSGYRFMISGSFGVDMRIALPPALVTAMSAAFDVSHCSSRNAASSFLAFLGMARPNPPDCDAPSGCGAYPTRHQDRVEVHRRLPLQEGVDPLSLTVTRNTRRPGFRYLLQ
jgi:hypothetical protein